MAAYNMTQETRDKFNNLIELIEDYGSMAVAFSGGVDSAFLARVAADVLEEDFVAITAILKSTPESDVEDVKRFAMENSLPLMGVKINELEIEGFKENPVDRCYICKKAVFGKMKEIITKERFLFLADGSNADDVNDYRPGAKALEELGIISPLKAVGLTKAEIRELSKQIGLFTWDKPSSACLSSRVPYGEEITEEKLAMIDKAESFLKEKGFGNCRVRVHGNLARVEVEPSDFEKIMEIKDEVHTKLIEIGFSYITLDLLGYRTGSLNEVIKGV